MKRMLASSQTTGAFIILDNDGTSNEYNSIFLRDPEPDVIDDEHKKFLIQFAPTEIVESFDFQKMPIYETHITLNGLHENILTKPIERELM